MIKKGYDITDITRSIIPEVGQQSGATGAVFRVGNTSDCDPSSWDGKANQLLKHM